MPGYTYRIICLLFATILAAEQAWLTWITKAMYVPPEDLIWYAGVLFGGLIGKSWMERNTEQQPASKGGSPQ